jgi:hypothetical protein
MSAVRFPRASGGRGKPNGRARLAEPETDCRVLHFENRLLNRRDMAV